MKRQPFFFILNPFILNSKLYSFPYCMARIQFPKTFAEQSELFRLILKKHNADGAASVLLSLLAEQNIDLAADDLARTAATAHEADRARHSATKENFREQRNNHFDPVMKHTRGYLQLLKKLYQPHTHRLGDWGATINHGGRIVYPVEFSKRTALFTKLAQKYFTYPAGTSPLEAYLAFHDLDISEDMLNTAFATVEDDNFSKASRDMETATANRNLKWKPVLAHMRKIAGFLIALYSNSPKRLGDWGFTVVDTLKAPTLITSRILLNSEKIVNGVIIGGSFINKGSEDLILHRGRMVSSTVLRKKY
jgi:hypothetical protein